MATIYVDGDAPSGGSGSALAPFQTLQEAVTAAQPFDLISVAAAAAPYDSPDGAPVRTVKPLDITCEPTPEISAEFFISGGARVEFRNARFVPRPRPVVDVDVAPWPQRGTLMASSGHIWLTDCDSVATGAGHKPLAYAYISSGLIVRGRTRDCIYDYRGSGQTVLCGWYGSYLTLRGQSNHKLSIGSDVNGPVVSLEASNGYLTDTELFGASNMYGVGIAMLRASRCVFSSTGATAGVQRGRFRSLRTGIAASRKSEGHVEPAVGFDGVVRPIVNTTGADVRRI